MFWLDYITFIEDLIVKRQPFNFTEACGVPVWYNSRICHTKNNAWFKRGIKFIGDLLDPLGQMESRGPMNTKWGISCNFLEYEQLRFRIQNFMRNNIDGTMFIKPCLPFLIQISNLSFKGCTHFYKNIKRTNRSILFQIKAKWEESLNDTVNFDQMKTCFSLCNKTTECTYLRYIQFKILQNRLVTQTLLKKMGKSESDACLYCKEIDTQVHTLLYCISTIQLWSNVEKWVRKDIQSHYKMCDWDKVFGNPKSSFIINAIYILNRSLGRPKFTQPEAVTRCRVGLPFSIVCQGCKEAWNTFALLILFLLTF